MNMNRKRIERYVQGFLSLFSSNLSQGAPLWKFNSRGHLNYEYGVCYVDSGSWKLRDMY